MGRPGRGRRQPIGGRAGIALAIACTLGFLLGIALGPPAVAAEDLTEAGPAAEPLDSAEREARIDALEAERRKLTLAGPITGVVVGALVFQGGLSTVISAQYNCPGYWDCSDETRWGITGGAGAAVLIGTIAVALTGSELSKRLRRIHALDREIESLKLGAPSDPAHARAARSGLARLGLGFDWMGGRKAVQIELRF